MGRVFFSPRSVAVIGASRQEGLLLLGGPDVRRDSLPSGSKREPAPKREDRMRMRSEYYKMMGWDENGIPATEELKSLSLERADKVLQKGQKRIKTLNEAS